MATTAGTTAGITMLSDPSATPNPSTATSTSSRLVLRWQDGFSAGGYSTSNPAAVVAGAGAGAGGGGGLPLTAYHLHVYEDGVAGGEQTEQAAGAMIVYLHDSSGGGGSGFSPIGSDRFIYAEVTGLKASTAYRFRLSAVNSLVGAVPSSLFIVVH